MVGNPFPVIEHPFKDQKNYNGKPINPGYQSHFTLGILFPILLVFSSSFHFFNSTINFDNKFFFKKIVDGRDKKTAFPITNVEELNEDWVVDELVVQESNQIYPSYIVYYN